ncbi:MAG: Uncharacterised protein [Flavobacterium sp. SCGC AAA160-P02]|nr:MAG: Uncharacterised protein [Flavobacterium sp. SCGC AAA160-P02]
MYLLKKTGLLLLILLFSFFSHKYYVSLTQIEYNSRKNSLEIIINVDMDDLEFTLNKDYDIDLKLTSKQELINSDVYFEKYLKKNLTISIDKVNREFNFLGKEYEGDLVYFYLEIDSIYKPISLDVSNKLLIKYFKEQQNIVKLKNGKKRQSKILSFYNNKALLNF